MLRGILEQDVRELWVEERLGGSHVLVSAPRDKSLGILPEPLLIESLVQAFLGGHELIVLLAQQTVALLPGVAAVVDILLQPLIRADARFFRRTPGLSSFSGSFQLQKHLRESVTYCCS